MILGAKIVTINFLDFLGAILSIWDILFMLWPELIAFLMMSLRRVRNSAFLQISFEKCECRSVCGNFVAKSVNVTTF